MGPGASDNGETAPPRPRPLQPRPLLDALVRHKVRFIILGGVAERILGSPRTTDDLDICAATTQANLARLAAMLNEVEARWLPPGLEATGFPPVERWNARSFASHTSVALLTRYGRFDIWFRPDGTDGYDDLIEKALDARIGEDTVKVVHVDDSIRIKRAIGGTKYLSHLPLLRDLQRQRREQGLE